MITTKAIPIPNNWTIQSEANAVATAQDVNTVLATLEVSSIDACLVPHLAAAAAELALVAGIPWRFSVDDAPVALLRLIAKVAIMAPKSGGPHTGRLYAQLRPQA